MRISLNDVKQSDVFLSGKLPPDELLFFQARMLTEPMLKWNVSCQEKVRSLVIAWGRRKRKKEIQKIHETLFDDRFKTEFQESILQIFKK